LGNNQAASLFSCSPYALFAWFTVWACVVADKTSVCFPVVALIAFFNLGYFLAVSAAVT
jgi:hypothetical protein